MSLTAFAPAKINLFLHVGPPGGDGYHPLASWMVFADVGDRLELVRDAGGRAIEVDGPFAADVPADGSNLAVRAQTLSLGDLRDSSRVGLKLTKMLPAAAGIGGGSSDAAAVLRLMNQYGQRSREELEALGATLGADVPACVRGESLIATGRGEVLRPGPAVPPLAAVLVNPGVDCPTGPVFRTYDGAATGSAELPVMPSGFMSAEAVAGFLRACRNDLQAAAVSVRPVIAEVLAILDQEGETLLARMSGSGATCFALCRDMAAAGRLAARLSEARCDWWVGACRLGGPWSDDFTTP